MSALQPFAIAILIGLLVGIEREKSHSSGPKTLGVRSFLLLSLLGALAGVVESEWLVAAAALFALGLILLSYWASIRHSKGGVDPGATTEIAAAVVFFLGYIADLAPTLSAILGPIVALVLFSKKKLHRFTDLIRPTELEATLLLLLLGVGVIELLPDRTIDPWELFNPRKFGTLVLVLGGLEFISYFAMKVLGARRGTIWVGFLGGLVSSTAVFLSSARRAKGAQGRWQNHAASALVAAVASLFQLLFIVGWVSMPLARVTALPILAASGVGLGFSLILWKKADPSEGSMDLRSPLNLLGVLRLAVLLAAILAAVALAQRTLGDRGTTFLTLLGGLFELHGVSLATATLQARNALSIAAAEMNIAVAVLGSFAAKIVLSLVVGGIQYGRMIATALVLMGLSFFVASFVVLS